MKRSSASSADESIQQLAHGRSSTLTARRSSMAAYASAASDERQLEVEDPAGLDRAREHVGQQLLDVAAHGRDAAVDADVAVEERAHGQLGSAVRRADVADHAAGSRGADRLVHRLLGADALEHAVGADAARELLHGGHADVAALGDDVRGAEVARELLALADAATSR